MNLLNARTVMERASNYHHSGHILPVIDREGYEYQGTYEGLDRGEKNVLVIPPYGPSILVTIYQEW